MVKDSVVHQIGERTLTILLGDPSNLPDPAAGAKTEVPAPTAQQLAELQAWRAQIAQIRFITVGATVYNHTETSFRWKDMRTGKTYEGWSNVDFNHLTGLAAADSAKLPFLKSLNISNVDTARLSTRRGSPVPVPHHPDLPADGPGFVVTSGDLSEAGVLAPIQELHAFYRLEKERLAAEYEAREQERLAKAAAPVPPSIPKDNVIWLRPRKGSRYLEQQASEEGGAE